MKIVYGKFKCGSEIFFTEVEVSNNFSLESTNKEVLLKCIQNKFKKVAYIEVNDSKVTLYSKDLFGGYVLLNISLEFLGWEKNIENS